MAAQLSFQEPALHCIKDGDAPLLQPLGQVFHQFLIQIQIVFVTAHPDPERQIGIHFVDFFLHTDPGQIGLMYKSR